MRVQEGSNYPFLCNPLHAVPLVVVGAYAYRKATGKEWPDALWKSYSIAADVPGSEINEDT